MAMERIPVGQTMDITYPTFEVSMTLESETHLTFEIKEGPFARSETVEMQVVPLGNSVFLMSWTEKDGAHVTNVQDHDRRLVHSHAILPNGQFIRQRGPFTIRRPAAHVSDARPQHNKALVVEAMTALFQRHDPSAVARLYAPGYVQHNPAIPQGREALQALVAGLSKDVYYEPGLVVAEGDHVAIHGRIRGWAAEPQVVVDLFRVENGQLAEHWDVLQNEVPVTATLGGVSMFDPEEGSRQARAIAD